MPASPDALTTTVAVAIPGRPGGSPSYRQELWQTAWVIVVSGLLAGVAIGIALRIAMLLLRLASPGSAGVISDDGFEIGEVTLFGSYNLLALGAALGVVGAAGYIAVMPFLIGPAWFRRATVAITAMILGGTAAIHADGVDFTLLDTEVAVALFLAVPLLAGLLVPPVVTAVAHRAGHWPAWLPVFALLFPVSLPVVLFQLAVVAALLPLRRARLEPILASTTRTWLVRGLFALVPLLALVGLVRDLTAVL